MGTTISPLAAAICAGLIGLVIGLAIEYVLFGEIVGGGAAGAAGAAAVATYWSRKKSSRREEPPA